MRALTDSNSWYENSVVYHVYPRTFCDALGEGTGNVEGILGKLDYLAQLHVNTLYVQDICSALPHLLDEDADGVKEREVLSSLSTAIQERGMRLLVDLPAAYTSPAHPWFLRSLKGDAPFDAYYLWRRGKGKTNRRPPDGRKDYGKSVWRTENGSDWYMHRLGNPLLDWGNAALREAFVAFARDLLSLGVDGFVVPADDMHVTAFSEGASIMERDAAYALIEAFVGTVKATGPCVFVLDIGADTLSRAKSLTYADGIRSSAHLPRNVQAFRNPRMPRLKQVLGGWQAGAYGRFVPNLYYESAALPRALGWLASDCGDYRKEAACMFATAFYMLRGTPFVYQGQEIGLLGHSLKRLSDITDPRFSRLAGLKLLSRIPFINRALLDRFGALASDNARSAMPWTALLPNAGFTAGTLRVPLDASYMQLNVQADLEKGDGVIAYFSRLLALRANPEYSAVLKYGVYKEYYPHSKDLYVYSRSYKGVTFIVVCNLRESSVPFTLPDRVAFADATLLLANYDMPAHLGAVTLRPYECMVYRLK